MAPKRGAAKPVPKKKGKKTLEAPVVSQDALDKAKKMLEDEAELKRRRSSIMYQLEISGDKKYYDRMGNTAINKDFIEKKIAQQIKKIHQKTLRNLPEICTKSTRNLPETWGERNGDPSNQQPPPLLQKLCAREERFVPPF